MSGWSGLFTLGVSLGALLLLGGIWAGKRWAVYGLTVLLTVDAVQTIWIGELLGGLYNIAFLAILPLDYGEPSGVVCSRSFC